jgi:hypothetical protein
MHITSNIVSFSSSQCKLSTPNAYRTQSSVIFIFRVKIYIHSDVLEVTKFFQNVKIVRERGHNIMFGQYQTRVAPRPILILQLCTRPIEFSIESNDVYMKLPHNILHYVVCSM